MQTPKESNTHILFPYIFWAKQLQRVDWLDD